MYNVRWIFWVKNTKHLFCSFFFFFLYKLWFVCCQFHTWLKEVHHCFTVYSCFVFFCMCNACIYSHYISYLNLNSAMFVWLKSVTSSSVISITNPTSLKWQYYLSWWTVYFDMKCVILHRLCWYSLGEKSFCLNVLFSTTMKCSAYVAVYML